MSIARLIIIWDVYRLNVTWLVIDIIDLLDHLGHFVNCETWQWNLIKKTMFM